MSGQSIQHGAHRPTGRCRRLAAVLASGAIPSGAIPSGAWAGASGPAVAPPVTVSAIDIVNVGGSLAMVLLAVMIIAWLYGRVQGLRGSSGQVINVVASQALGPKERVLIVDVAGQQLVLGVTTAGMRTLHVLESPVDADTGSSSIPSFATRLGEALKKRAS